MSDVGSHSDPKSASHSRRRITAALVAASIALSGVVVFVVLADPFTSQIFAIGAVMAAAPLAVLIGGHVQPTRIVALGGAMTVAGVATMFGGNMAGLLMAVLGLPILLVGGYKEPSMSTGVVVRLIAYAVLLIAAMLLSLGDANPMLLISFFISVVVATNPIWDQVGRSEF
ncbi:MAG TPA: hypothetical protein VE569_02900 [Acidimicrobiia bacterium]|nr:hypothetical protein [Acidimicrobiia bacterium]